MLSLPPRFAALACAPVALLLLACPVEVVDDESADIEEVDGGDEPGTAEGEEAEETGGTDEGGPYGHGNLNPDCIGDAPVVVFETNLGTMTVELDAVRAPITVENFLGYVSAQHYDQTVFHRVIDGFVIQGGGFDTDFNFLDTQGTIVLEIHPELRHVDGALAMARSNDPDSAEAQWYITDGAQGGLDDNYAVFGFVTEGLETRDAISAVPTGSKDIEIDGQVYAFEDVPVDNVVVQSMYCAAQ
ncbi:peptidylprolyl isomerase [Plesiocystis pacifica]|uniref:peptidylprolyl isomerase n=1 Tax=Plesiocystis pacifica TaxID=191768 RepID=UPI0018DE4B07|nr:peptidylprolyl isomerase [Plesiocystis pacifica]